MDRRGWILKRRPAGERKGSVRNEKKEEHSRAEEAVESRAEKWRGDKRKPKLSRAEENE